jgi:hypothetical protein
VTAKINIRLVYSLRLIENRAEQMYRIDSIEKGESDDGTLTVAQQETRYFKK